MTSREFNKEFKKYGFKLEFAGYDLYQTCMTRCWSLKLVDERGIASWQRVYSMEDAYAEAKTRIKLNNLYR